jgi:hypothetical protein
LQESKVHEKLQTNEILAKLQQLAKVPARGEKLRGGDRQTDRENRERERRTHTHLVWEVSFEAFRADFCIGKDFDQ